MPAGVGNFMSKCAVDTTARAMLSEVLPRMALYADGAETTTKVVVKCTALGGVPITRLSLVIPSTGTWVLENHGVCFFGIYVGQFFVSEDNWFTLWGVGPLEVV